MDEKVFALFNSISASVGTEDSAITVDNIMEAIATLRADKISGPLNAIIGQDKRYKLKKRYTMQAAQLLLLITMVLLFLKEASSEQSVAVLYTNLHLLSLI
jgi:hypothetical protein